MGGKNEERTATRNKFGPACMCTPHWRTHVGRGGRMFGHHGSWDSLINCVAPDLSGNGSRHLFLNFSGGPASVLGIFPPPGICSWHFSSAWCLFFVYGFLGKCTSPPHLKVHRNPATHKNHKNHCLATTTLWGTPIVLDDLLILKNTQAAQFWSTCPEFFPLVFSIFDDSKTHFSLPNAINPPGICISLPMQMRKAFFNAPALHHVAAGARPQPPVIGGGQYSPSPEPQ